MYTEFIVSFSHILVQPYQEGYEGAGGDALRWVGRSTMASESIVICIIFFKGHEGDKYI
jgi:hypothetical protein